MSVPEVMHQSLEPLEVNRVPENEIIHQLKSNDESDSIIANQNIEDLNEEIDNTELENEIVSAPPLEENIVPKIESHEHIEEEFRIPKKKRRRITIENLQSYGESDIIIGIQSSKGNKEIDNRDLENEIDSEPLEGNRVPGNETHKVQNDESILLLQSKAIESNSEQTDFEVEQPTNDSADNVEQEKKKRKRRKDTISNWHCTYCGDGYKTKNGVYSHVSRVSTRCIQIHALSGKKAIWEDEVADREKKFRCEICKKGFKSSESLRIHNHRFHK